MPAINSGWKLFSKLAESGTGKSKLDHLFPLFKPNRKGKPTQEVDAEDFLEFMDELDDEFVPPTTKEKAHSFHLTGDYQFKCVPIAADKFELPDAPFATLPDGEPEAEVKVAKKRGRPRKVKVEQDDDE